MGVKEWQIVDSGEGERAIGPNPILEDRPVDLGETAGPKLKFPMSSSQAVD